LVAVYEEEDPTHVDWEQGSAASSEGKNASHHSSHLAPHLSHSSSGEFYQIYCMYLDTCSKNDVIMFSRKGYCALI